MQTVFSPNKDVQTKINGNNSQDRLTHVSINGLLDFGIFSRFILIKKKIFSENIQFSPRTSGDAFELFQNLLKEDFPHNSDSNITTRKFLE